MPVNEYRLQQPDQPVLCGPGSDKPGADVVRFVGDQIALVVAETDVIVENEYRLPYQEHAYLQPEAGLAQLSR